MSSASPASSPVDAAKSDVKDGILDEAGRIVTGARRSAYGTPENNLERIAPVLDGVLRQHGAAGRDQGVRRQPIHAADEGGQALRNPRPLDSFTDIVGYALTGPRSTA